jgi:hypothetical protein
MTVAEEDDLTNIDLAWIGRQLIAIENALGHKKLPVVPRFEAPTYGKKGEAKKAKAA